VKRLAVMVGLLVSLGIYSPLEARGHKSYRKETTADMSDRKTIFLGWVDLPTEGWSLWGYVNRQEWVNVIKDLNQDFQNSCQGQYLD
jgi:hypothetical protein